MTKKQENKILESIKKQSKEILSSKENAQKFLKELGVYTKKGKLSSNYR